MIKPEIINEIAVLTNKSIAHINNKYYYWEGNDELSTVEVDTSIVNEATNITNTKLLTYELDLLREKRDELLAITDWWVLPDRSPSTAQLTYRQALRDITQTYTSLSDVVWPSKPE